MEDKESALPGWLEGEYMKLPELPEETEEIWTMAEYKGGEKRDGRETKGNESYYFVDSYSGRNRALSNGGIVAAPKRDLAGKWKFLV